jgi:hypothetical protein
VHERVAVPAGHDLHVGVLPVIRPRWGVALAVLLAALPARGGDVPDTVILNDGSRLRGTISVEDPKEGVTIVLADGSVHTIKPQDVKRVVYGGGIARSAAPAPAPAPAAAPLGELPPPAPDATPAWAPRPRPGGKTLTALWVPSLVVLSATYLTTIITTAVITANWGPDRQWDGLGYAFVPGAGPWIIFGVKGSQLGGLPNAMLVMSGILQDLSVAGLIVGLSVRTGEGAARVEAPRWMVVPSVGPHFVGATATVVAF